MGTHPIFESDFDCLTDRMASNDMNDISRPTSRVLAPPGGGSSNIFGTAPEPVRKSNPNDPRHRTNNIFGGAEPAPAKTTPKPAPTVTEPAKSSTQEVNPVGAPGLKRPSTKVHAPPGGHSSISFG